MEVMEGEGIEKSSVETEQFEEAETTESETESDTETQSGTDSEREPEQMEVESVEEKGKEGAPFTKKHIDKAMLELDLVLPDGSPSFVLSPAAQNALLEYLDDYTEDLAFLTVEMAAQRTHSKHVSLRKGKAKPKPKSINQEAIIPQDVELAMKIVTKRDG